MATTRQLRTADQIHRILSELLLRQVNDPRLRDVTVTQVTVDRELQHADVYVNALGDETRQDQVMAGLANAAGYLRRELAQRISLRSVPQLRFHWDPRLVQAEEVDQLLDSLDIPPEVEQPSESDLDQ